MRSKIGQVIELGTLDAPRGPVRVTLCPLGEAWVVWVHRDGSRTRQHLGVLSLSPRGYVLTSRNGDRTEADDWRALVKRIVTRHP